MSNGRSSWKKRIKGMFVHFWNDNICIVIIFFSFSAWLSGKDNIPSIILSCWNHGHCGIAISIRTAWIRAAVYILHEHERRVTEEFERRLLFIVIMIVSWAENGLYAFATLRIESPDCLSGLT